MPLTNEKIQPLLQINSLSITMSIGEKESGASYDVKYLLYLYEKNEVVGKCELTKERFFNIERIDINKNKRNLGYGSILLYAVLLEIQKHKITKCCLAGFPINLSFYFRNGFYPDENLRQTPNDWYGLSLDQQVEIIYQKKRALFASREDFLKDGFEQIYMDFDFNSHQAMHSINSRIDDIEYQTYRNLVKNIVLDNPFVSNIPLIEHYIDSLHKFLQPLEPENRNTLFLWKMNSLDSNVTKNINVLFHKKMTESAIQSSLNSSFLELK